MTNPMRILMVTEDIPAPQIGGLGKHVVTLANALIKLGHHVDILGRSDRDADACQAEMGFRGTLIPGFAFPRSGWKELQLGMAMPPKRPAMARSLAQAIVQHAGGYDVVHYHGHLPLVAKSIPAELSFVQTRHDQGSECVMHTRFANGDVCTLMEAGDCARCFHPAPGRIRRAVTRAAVSRYRRETADGFAKHRTIFVSRFLFDRFRQAVPGADMARCHVVHNFVDVTRLNKLVQKAGPVAPGTLLLAGRIDASKGFGPFLERAVVQASGAAHLLVVGDGPDRAALESRFKRDNVVFHGWSNYPDVIRMTARAHVCVVPSVWEEPCGTTVLEALALGRPCHALARGGTPELVRYERYPGQLQLSRNMDDLVTSALRTLRTEAPALPQTDSFGADVHETIPRLLAIYRASLS